MVPSRSIILVVLAHLTHLSGIAAAISTELSPVCELLVVPYGYPCEDHHVTTDDGFTLLLNRIRYGRSQGGDRGGYVRPAILLQHGLMVGSESWLLSGPGEALGFVLADAGFDVWLGNARGSRWNLDHVTLAKTDKAYWDWTFEEMAEFDLPAMLETVCENTGQPRVLVAAHSQRISAALLLCPIAFLGHVASRPCKAAAEIFLDKVVGKIGFKEFNFNSALGAALVNAACIRANVNCAHIVEAFSGPNCCVNATAVKAYLEWIPSPTSVRNLAHLAQLIRSGKWQRYDYGRLGNFLRYGRLTPPEFLADLMPSTVPLAFAVGSKDILSVASDVSLLFAAMAEWPKDLWVMEDYAHLDFIFGALAREDFYEQHALPFLRAHSNSSREVMERRERAEGAMLAAALS
eukprot:TRINITY_DN2203_c0_g1_i5.p1 TRINITY_DN2203_c0_g1~~TRINITY_DN2203_c0_g1_i5.p1  ORF type:complete len:405 (+),score=70.98 TRINITY_DN2203_c0_g1_i5:169-1383(+)